MVPLGGRNKGRNGTRFGRFLKSKWKAVTAILVVIVLLVTATAMSISSLITMFEDADDEDEDQAGAYTTVTLYVQAMTTDNKPVANVTVDLQPTTKNKDGSEIQMPATGKDGIASTVIGTSGGAFGDISSGTSYYMSCSGYNPTKYQRSHGNSHPHPECAGAYGGDSKLRCYPGVLATDPFIIPHGSIVYIQVVNDKTLKPTGQVYGFGEAADTGGFLYPSGEQYGTAPASQGPIIAGYKPQGAHDRKGGKVYKRGVDCWFDTVEAASAWGTKLCKVTIVDATKPGCMNGHLYVGKKDGGNGAYERQATWDRLQKARGGSVTDGSGGVAASYGDYTVTCTGGLTCGKFGASGSLDVDSLVNGNTQTITIPGGKLKFWVDISTDQDGDLGAGATDYLQWMKKVADTHQVGYSQTHRQYTNNPSCKDVDCSSFVYYALLNTGYLKGESKTSAFRTDGEPAVLKKHGFKEISVDSQYSPKPGDILWYRNGRHGHTEVYVGGKGFTCIGAHADYNGKCGWSKGGRYNWPEVGMGDYGSAGKSGFTHAFRFSGTKK